MTSADPAKRGEGGGARGALPRLRASGGFTLVELLLVAAIIGIIAAVTMPTFVRSMRGHRLRAAARTVVMAGRYARSMAVLKQTEMAVLFDLDMGRIRIGPVEGVRADEDPLDVAEEPGDGEDPPPAVRSFAGAELSRRLEGVTIQSVVVEGEDGTLITDGTAMLVYRTNGTCEPYRVELEEAHGGRLWVDVDSLATATTESR